VVGPRQAMREVLKIASAGEVKCVCEEFALDDANEALQALKRGDILVREVLIR
jgi:D-arabinose 1-dehydrogenase-like Zn-dependent alcohol dehydrogenase